MKANELMIGNWVMVNDVEHTHPLQVAEIFKKSGAYYATLYWDGMPDNVKPETLTADIDKVLPIPLTPEILEKIGFKREGGASYWHEGGHDACILHWNKDKVQLIVGCPSDDYMVKMNVKHVHELQHAFRLCGINKEIEL